MVCPSPSARACAPMTSSALNGFVSERVQLEGDQQRGRDQGPVLGPKLVEPEPDSFDQLESAVSERGERDDSQLV